VDIALDWLQEAVYGKLIDRSGGVSRTVALAQRLFSFADFHALADRVEADGRADRFGALADVLGIRFAFEGLDNLRAAGDRPVILYGNHATGGTNVLAMCKLLADNFPDYRIFGNRHMKFLPALSEKMVAVDPFRSACALNLDALIDVRREFGTAYRALGIFPAGIASHFSVGKATITDRQWSDAFMRIARHHDALLVPVWFSGRNRLRYYLAAKIRRELGFLALPGEFLRARGETVTVRIGRPVSPDMLDRISGRHARMSFLRAGVYELGRSPVAATPRAASPVSGAFHLPFDVASRGWRELPGTVATSADIRACRRALEAAAPDPVVAAIRLRSIDAVAASLEAAVLQKLYGDPVLLRARPRQGLIDTGRHHDWRPQRDCGGADDVRAIDPMLRRLARRGVRFGAAGFVGADPCILARLDVSALCRESDA
jgi:putative hemolysin